MSSSVETETKVKRVPSPTQGPLLPDKENYLRVADETESMLREDVLDVWFPRSVNWDGGGFYSAFTREWRPDVSEGKFSVFQARFVWVAAQVMMRRPELKPQYAAILQHGVKFLRDTLWDKQYGGFYWGVDDQDRVSSFYSDGKHLYGISFCLYGLASAYQATKDAATLDLAQLSFRWMEDHAHDNKDGGYFEWLTRDGHVLKTDADSAMVAEVPVAAFPVGYKSMNAHIHLLEAYTELYKVWPDKLLRRRLEELLVIVRDRISVEPGVMNLFFTNDWKPLPQNDSYGHDVETAYLMLEAEEALGDARSERTSRMARLLVNHALAYGWDETYGGFFQSGPAVGKATDRRKEWWVQFEGLNALLRMHDLNGHETDKYFEAFRQQWSFIKKYLRDAEYHGVYELVGEDAKPISTLKARIWKCAYHETRSLLNVSDRLRKLAGASL